MNDRNLFFIVRRQKQAEKFCSLNVFKDARMKGKFLSIFILANFMNERKHVGKFCNSVANIVQLLIKLSRLLWNRCEVNKPKNLIIFRAKFLSFASFYPTIKWTLRPANRSAQEPQKDQNSVIMFDQEKAELCNIKSERRWTKERNGKSRLN